MAPFPILPMMAIMASLVSAMVVQMSVFAYAGFMVEYLGVVDDKDEAGFYAGAMSTAYMFGRVCSSHVWGMVADRCGRRFVLVFGILSNAVLSVVFGCSTTFTMAVMSRFLLGLLNGVIVVSRTLVSEVCSKEHEIIGMGFVTTSWTIGGVFGPGVGGLLSEPAKHHPQTFSERGIFGRYPYLLPNLVGAGLALLALPLVLVYIKDTEHAASEFTKVNAWCSPCCYFSGSGRDVDNSGDSKGGDEDGGSLTYTESGLAVQAPGIRKPSWMKADTVPPAARRNASGRNTDRREPIPNGGTTPGRLLAPVQFAEAERASSVNEESALELEVFGIRKPSWMQPEMVPLAARRDGHGQGAEHLVNATIDAKPENLLAQGNVRILIFINGIFAFTFSGFDEVFPLWALSSVAKGGLDWSSLQIGKVFLFSRLALMAFEIFLAVPYLTPWLGVKLSQRMASVCEIAVYILVPLLSLFNGDEHLDVVLSAILLFTAYSCVDSLLCVSLAINNAVESGRRAELNGLSATFESVVRAISPMACSALFAFSISGDYSYPFEYHFVFYALVLTRLITAFMGWNRIADNGNMG